MTITDTIRRVRELDAEATKGPWRVGSVESWHVFCPSVHADAMGPERVLLRMNEHFQYEHDAALIAYYRTAAPALADECERLAALFQQTHGVHHGWVAECQRLRERVRVLEEALAWYSDIRGYTSPGADDGRIARAALEGK